MLATKTENCVLQSLETSLRETFEMMTGESLMSAPETSAAVESGKPQQGVTVVMGLTGQLNGSVCIGLSNDAALLWTKCLIDHETDTIDQTVVDAIGELGNIVVGGCKRRLSPLELQMSLPNVVKAHVRCVAKLSNITPLNLHFLFQDCEIEILAHLEETGQ